MEKAINSITDFWETYSLRLKVWGVLALFVIVFVWPWIVGIYHIIF
jgi:hypothetical protein